MSANASAAAPISVPPSQQWDGNDGPWSSFSIHVGTPPQAARVLVSTTVGETWVVSQNSTQGGCLSTDPSTCPNSRGGLVNVNASSTWQDQGIFALGDEQNLPDYIDQYDNGDYGLDTLGIGLPGSGGVTLDRMVVAAIATKDWYIGNLGVNQQPTNFSAFTDPHPSFLKSLKQSGKIPSLTYGYTAGNQYRLKKVFGSLTLGGYDASKYVANGNSFQFAGDISRDLVVGLQSIIYSDSTTTNKQLLSSGILTFVDATVPHIWLPVSACQAFEKAFGITYNSTANRYLVNDTQHTAMQNQNASVSFVLGNVINGGATVNITLPYAAFDLTTGPPIVDNTTRYFPLRQAANDTQYTLGRTFLQEAYLIVDYERSNFSLSQAAFNNDPSNLVLIQSVTNKTSTPPGVTKTTNNSSSISIGALVGIVIAAVFLIAGAIGAFFYIRHRKRKSSKGAQKLDDDFDPLAKAEMDGQGKTVPIELFGSEGKLDSKADPNSEFEMEGSKGHLEAKLAAEMEGSKGGHEMAAGGPSILTGRKVAEMEGEGEVNVPVEMYAGPHGLYELDSPVATPGDGPRGSAGLPTPTSGGLRSSDGMPSPITPPAADKRRSSGTGRIKSWARRSKPVPRLPGDDSAGEDGISSQDEHSSWTGGIWAPRRSSRPLGANTAYRTLDQGPLSSRSAGNSGRGESTRDRHRRGADALTRRLESSASLVSASNYGTPKEGLSPSGSPRPENNSNRYDTWNQRFGSSQRGNDMPSPRPSPRQRLDSSQSGLSGYGAGGSRRPSDQSGLMSPVSPADDGPTGRIPSPRIPRSGGGSRSLRPPDPPAPPPGGFF